MEEAINSQVPNGTFRFLDLPETLPECCTGFQADKRSNTVPEAMEFDLHWNPKNQFLRIAFDGNGLRILCVISTTIWSIVLSGKVHRRSDQWSVNAVAKHNLRADC